MSQTHLKGKDQPRVTVWCDGDCPLCRAEISLYQRLDQKAGRIAFVDLTGAQLPLILPFLDWLYGQFLKVRPRLQTLMVDREKRQG